MVNVEELKKEDLVKAIEEAKGKSGERNFRQTVEIIITTEGLDLKKPENRVRQTISLPKEIGRPRKICVFAEGRNADRALEAGADRVMARRELEGLSGNKKAVKKMAGEYDFFLSEPQLISLVGRVCGSALGPRGKTPQVITPTTDLDKTMKELKNSSRLYLRNRPEASCGIGTMDMPSEDLAENVMAVVHAFYTSVREKAKIDRIYVKTTMGRPVRVA